MSFDKEARTRALRFSAIIHASYNPNQLRALADRVASIERSTTIGDIIATHERARFAAEQSDGHDLIDPSEWGDTEWEDRA